MIYYATNYDQYKYGKIVYGGDISSILVPEAVIGTAWCPYDEEGSKGKSITLHGW